MSTLDPTLEPERLVRRIEVINGIGARRRWSLNDKAHIVEETLVPGAVVSEIARRHGLTPQQVFGWRRQARRPLVTSNDLTAPLFVPAVVEPPSRDADRQHRGGKRERGSSGGSGMIELEVGGVTVRVGRGAPAKTIAAVIRALKAS